jgi:hypothetical protein
MRICLMIFSIQTQVATALFDCGWDEPKAIELLIEEGGGLGLASWEKTEMKKKKKSAMSNRDKSRDENRDSGSEKEDWDTDNFDPTTSRREPQQLLAGDSRDCAKNQELPRFKPVGRAWMTNPARGDWSGGAGLGGDQRWKHQQQLENEINFADGSGRGGGGGGMGLVGCEKSKPELTDIQKRQNLSKITQGGLKAVTSCAIKKKVGGGPNILMSFTKRFKEIQRLQIKDLEKKDLWKNLQRKLRKYYFSYFKNLNEDIAPYLNEILSYVFSEKCELRQAFVINLILDIQELLKISKCKGISTFNNYHEYYSRTLNDIHRLCHGLNSKVLVTKLQIVLCDVLLLRNKGREKDMMPNVSYIIKQDLCLIQQEVFNILKKDLSLNGVTVLDLKNVTVYCLLSHDFQKAFFFDAEGLSLEANIQEISLLRRKEVYYISIKGKYSLLSNIEICKDVLLHPLFQTPDILGPPLLSSWAVNFFSLDYINSG